MRVHVRLADDADEDVLRQLDDLALRGDTERSGRIGEAVASRQCLVAEDTEVVGYVVTAPGRFFGRDFVELLVVHSDHRRRGIGRALLRAAVDRTATTRVFSSTNESNDAMHALFASEGWTASGRITGLDEGDPEVVYFIDRTG